ncbi:hypothetical protein SB11R_00005, partial [Pseudomonas oryzihabitans]
MDLPSDGQGGRIELVDHPASDALGQLGGRRIDRLLGRAVGQLVDAVAELDALEFGGCLGASAWVEQAATASDSSATAPSVETLLKDTAICFS